MANCISLRLNSPTINRVGWVWRQLFAKIAQRRFWLLCAPRQGRV